MLVRLSFLRVSPAAELPSCLLLSRKTSRLQHTTILAFLGVSAELPSVGQRAWMGSGGGRTELVPHLLPILGADSCAGARYDLRQVCCVPTVLVLKVLSFPLLFAPPELVLELASCSRKFCQSSAKVSLLAGLGASGKYSLDNAGVEGVRCTVGEAREPRREPKVPGAWAAGPPPPGRERPARSCCSSLQPSKAAMSWRTWNFLGSDLSSARNCKK
jgi:hypothetical protein